jgi:peptidyl-prolyl cis-trans isomerase B (cyclophilin B)
MAMGNSVFQDFSANPANAEYNKRGQYYTQMGNKEALEQLQQEVAQLCKPKLDELFNKIPAYVKNRYINWGGAPNLDNNYTVFGKLVSGYHVLSAIESQPTNMQDRPTRDISIIEAKVLK